MTCHSVSMLEHTKGNGSYNIALPSPDLFRNSGIPIIQHIGDFLLRVRPEKHKRDMLKPVMNDSSYCASCHSQYMEENMNNWGWVKMQDEYTAWANSPYSGQHPFGFSDENIQRCQDCHMPMVPVDGLAADSNGDGASHRFLGSNTFLPSVSNDNQQLGLVSDFLRSNKVRVSIVEPNRIESIQTRSSLQADLREKSLRESTAFYYHGETTNLEVVVANIAVGHNFPGGTIDLNQVWLEVIVTDAVGQEIYTSGALDDDGVLSETAYVYGAIAVDRQGKEVWKHDLFNMTGEVFHRTIKSGDADVAKFDLFIPAWANSPLTISATLRYRKFNKRYSSWVMHGAKHSLPIVDMAFDRKTIPLKKRREVE